MLRYLLQNTQGLKIGCIVNDVASVNIDAKLVRNDQSRGGDPANSSTTDLADTIELQNGCVCTCYMHQCSHTTTTMFQAAPSKTSSFCRFSSFSTSPPKRASCTIGALTH